MHKVSLVRTAFVVLAAFVMTAALMAVPASAGPILDTTFKSALADSELSAFLGTDELPQLVSLDPAEEPLNADVRNGSVSGKRDDRDARSYWRTSVDAISFPALGISPGAFRPQRAVDISPRESSGTNADDAVSGTALVHTEDQGTASQYASLVDAIAALTVPQQPSGSSGTAEQRSLSPRSQWEATSPGAGDYARALGVSPLGGVAFDRWTSPDTVHAGSRGPVGVPEPSTLVLTAVALGLLRRKRVSR